MKQWDSERPSELANKFLIIDLGGGYRCVSTLSKKAILLFYVIFFICAIFYNKILRGNY